jgi:hypothetical protein
MGEHMTETITVKGQRPYPVLVGHDLFNAVIGALPDSASRVAVIHPRASRASMYASVADLRVGTDGRGVGDVADEIAKWENT